jgi:demethylmenaquinone methyltransferase / 2-methoxy-6-polyprenyl-1,4-benzoquinol methylase
MANLRKEFVCIVPDPIKVRSMFSRISGRYDLANKLLSGGTDLYWRKRLVWEVRNTQSVELLDLATGSGDVAFALADGMRPGVKIIGMDFCQPMLDEALKKQSKAMHRNRIDFRQGDGMAIPLPAQCMDAVTISFGLRNMADRHRCLQEIHRVLRNDGHLIVLEFSQPVWWFKPLYYTYLKFFMPRIAGLVTGDQSAYEYLCGSIENYPDHTAMCGELHRAGFKSVTARRMTGGIVALHHGNKLQ